jgi:DNA-3-methyladenine glycosylase I (EC 3.2.2.20)
MSAPPLVDNRPRCFWADPADRLYCAYHDEEWGVPQRDPRALWELLVLESFQAGLAWITILRKRDGMRAAFDQFDPVVIANYGEADIARLLEDPRIIRSRAKIQSTIAAAQIYQHMLAEGDDFSGFLWSFIGGAPRVNHWRSRNDLPAQTAESAAMSAALKAKGFKFCGPVICYAFMQASGMVDDHLPECWRRINFE